MLESINKENKVNSVQPKYKGIFYPAPYILTGAGNPYGESWIAKTTKAPTNRELPWTKLEDAAAAKRKYPVLSGKLATPKFSGYCNEDAGWADASKTVSQLRDDCLELGHFLHCTIRGVKTLSGSMIQGDHFIVTAGAWMTGLVPMYNSTLVTAQVESAGDRSYIPSPPRIPPRERANFAPPDGEQRLRQGLVEMFPELGDRPFERLALCWYTDTPSGDFIMDYHPDYRSLFVGGAGSGHAFKFLPVLGEYMSQAIKKTLPCHLAKKWRFRKDYGSRGGPARRELQPLKRASFENLSCTLLLLSTAR
ncbi:uncharacterized protein ASPGLDRAFT_68007 [Aspergillus glaucus CBS 516.65]|uniref:FAD dependent oxidoreductase domain-containing protein n=1 Tax=Aspergillus glaucus CBS 516.65 TaxID=1160497 RepID=A0A1L9VFB0_ASPGL|nr:hypothetical protein ASPGLDRAFT_68007 [Aspergillus glaucus CBS 516.65]OJJ82583.1 hypothetical protein ASPGLDRAFT_68007 [Aspergillus glaucus CBS 516.65]